jgi:hypothetical protein
MCEGIMCIRILTYSEWGCECVSVVEKRLVHQSWVAWVPSAYFEGTYCRVLPSAKKNQYSKEKGSRKYSFCLDQSCRVSAGSKDAVSFAECCIMMNASVIITAHVQARVMNLEKKEEESFVVVM